MAAAVKYYAKDFEWGDHLGEGAFGAVTLVTHKESGVKYACKILSKAQITKEKKIKYVKTERNILVMCDSPYIVSLFCTFSDPDYLHYVLELCPNGELFGQLRKHKNFSVDVCQFYTAELVCALEHLHSKSIIHRDLKPENILLTGDWHVKLTDFGTSKVIGEEEGSSADKKEGISRSQSFVGTAEYLCPELLNDKYCCMASDLWALGAILFQLITGKMAYHGATQFLTFQKIQSNELEWPINKDAFPADARDLVERLLQVEPHSRLGAGEGGYNKLKGHAFFQGLSWDSLYKTTPPAMKPGAAFKFKEDEEKEKAEEVKRKLVEQTEKWKKHLNANELVYDSGMVSKKRGMSVKKRMLLLTDGPRLLYIDVKADTTMGQIPWTGDMSIEVKSSKEFNILTPGRKWIFSCHDKSSEEWEKAIKNMLEKVKE